MNNKLNLEGKMFGKFTVIKQDGVDKEGSTLWACACRCGNIVTVKGTSLKSGNSTQCKLCVSKTHGMSSTNFYKVWQGMKTRCSNPNAINFNDYGGRGIAYDPNWEHFETFYRDMINGYSEGLYLERTDNSKGYCKDNCKWVTPKEQNENMRSNVYISYRGDKLSAESIAEMTGLTRAAIYHRHRDGWSGERIVSTPMISKEEQGRMRHAR